MWRKMRVAGAAALAVMMMAGCAAEASQGGNLATQPLKVVGPLEVHSLDPSTSNGIFTRLQIAETLVDADEGGGLQPGLATGWETTPDQLTWRFALRSQARFHDGTEVTAEAAAAALNTAAAKEGTPLSSVPLKSITDDGDAVRVELNKPYAPLAAVLAHTSTQILAPDSYGPDQTVTQVIGSGPYRATKVEQPANVEMVAFEQWDGEKPVIEAVSYQAVGRSESRALMAESGQADVTFGMDPTSLQRLKQSGGVEIADVTLPRTILLKVNAGHEILGDVRVRQALSLALDRDGMATALLRDPEMAATQLFPPSLPQWHQESVEPLVHDQSAAAELLAEAGWGAGSDGVLERGGEKFEITLRTFPDRPELPILATAIQAKLKELGITVNVEVGNSSAIPAGHEDGSLDLGLYARNFALVPDALVTLAEDFGPDGADWGAMGWTNKILTETLASMASGVAPSEAETGRGQVTEILQSELPVIPVAWYRQSAAVSERIDGLVLDPLERSWRLADLTWAK